MYTWREKIFVFDEIGGDVYNYCAPYIENFKDDLHLDTPDFRIVRHETGLFIHRR